MESKIVVDLEHTQKTLLLPLWGRAVESRKERPRFVDAEAVRIVDRLAFDFSTIAANINPLTQYAWIARALHIERAVRRFLQSHPRGSVVNLGCGLDTTFDRIDNGVVRWYDIDLPDVIELRRSFIGDTDRRTMIAMSCLDEAWFDTVAKQDGILFVAGGVLYYFQEATVKALICRLADIFPGSELFFDAASPLGVRVSNALVIRAGGMDESAVLRWGLKDPREIEQWDDRIKVVEASPMFRGMRKGLPLKTLVQSLESDILKIMYMVRLRLG